MKFDKELYKNNIEKYRSNRRSEINSFIDKIKSDSVVEDIISKKFFDSSNCGDDTCKIYANEFPKYVEDMLTIHSIDTTGKQIAKVFNIEYMGYDYSPTKLCWYIKLKL